MNHLDLQPVMSYAEIGAQLGIADSTVWATEQRALKKLRRKLAHLAPDGPDTAHEKRLRGAA